tara:strand:+ start:61 stop:375 length:315 start_codon:yes stop_codon:yes gene_type:complete
MGYKLKTKKAAAKRFWKSSAKGKIRRGVQGHGHFLSKMGQKARKLQGTTTVSESNFDMVARMLPMLNAKKKRTKALNKEAQALKAANTSASKAGKKSIGKAAAK